MICFYCNKEFTDTALVFDSKEFHSIKCVLDYSDQKIKHLTKESNAWHNAWFELREIIGRLGLYKLHNEGIK